MLLVSFFDEAGVVVVDTLFCFMGIFFMALAIDGAVNERKNGLLYVTGKLTVSVVPLYLEDSSGRADGPISYVFGIDDSANTLIVLF